MNKPARVRSGWVLGPVWDSLIFSGPVLFSLGLIALLSRQGLLSKPMPPSAFLVFIVGFDVSHVWATAYRSYLDPERLRARLQLFLLVPLICLAGGVVLHGHSGMLFWRVLAYLAVWHFVRQQWGWMAMSRRQAGERGSLERGLDQVAIYNATLFPLFFWHTHLPRAFVWFVPGDFLAGLNPAWYQGALALHWSLNGLYLFWQGWRLVRGRGVNWGKLQIWATTWVAWYGGIVLLNSDWAFTLLNVLSHGVPYLAVVHRVERLRHQGEGGFLGRLFRPRMAWAYLGLLLLAGFLEEWGFDKTLWHEHPGLFPGPDWFPSSPALSFLVPLLALPQATHYVLDGWLWRWKSNPDLRALYGEGRAPRGSQETMPEGGLEPPLPKKGTRT